MWKKSSGQYPSVAHVFSVIVSGRTHELHVTRLCYDAFGNACACTDDNNGVALQKIRLQKPQRFRVVWNFENHHRLHVVYFLKRVLTRADDR